MTKQCRCRRAALLAPISLIYTYSITGGPGVSLASDNQYFAHGDFFNAWDAAELDRLVSGCLNALRHCQRGD